MPAWLIPTALPEFAQTSRSRVELVRELLRRHGKAEALADMEVDAQQRAVRRALREHRRMVRATPQCGGCRRFVRNPNLPCPNCGMAGGRYAGAR